MSIDLFLFKKRLGTIYSVDGDVHSHHFIASLSDWKQITTVSTSDFKYGDGIIRIKEILDIRYKVPLTRLSKFTEILKSIGMPLLHNIGF